jgi:hypothetical protein
VGQVGRAAVAAIPQQLLQRLQLGTAVVIIVVGAAMSVGAWRQIADMR